MFFTQEDYKKIEEYLKLNAKKDTDFLEFVGLLDENDIIAIVHKGQSYKISLYQLASTIVDKVIELVSPNFNDILELLDSLVIGGVALKQDFGDERAYGISLKVLTAAFNRIWGKLGDLTGEVLQGINMIVTPTYFIGEEATIRITANSVEANGIFEKISFYWNDEDENETEEHTTAFYTAENVPSITPYIEVDVPMDKVNPITNKIKIKCIAHIMGLTYTREQFVTHCSEFWLGASTSYLDIINAGDRYTIPITNGMRGSYDVTVEDGQSIIIIVSKSLREGFIRADLNSVEIPFTEIMLTSEYNETLNETEAEYIAFVSSSWIAGTYNIDING